MAADDLSDEILRSCVALLTARADEDLVQQVMNQQLADIPQGVHAAHLKVMLRTVVVEFFHPMARMVDEIAPGFTSKGLSLQAAANEGVDLDDDGPANGEVTS